MIYNVKKNHVLLLFVIFKHCTPKQKIYRNRKFFLRHFSLQNKEK